MEDKKILLGHGSGGQLSNQLIKNLFVKHFQNDILLQQSDSALLNINAGLIAYTTDSYVVDPIFFPGGNIGKLAVCGTVNDLSVSGAKPLYLSVGFIIEEGFSLKELETIVITMKEEADKAGVKIVTGDTKVVDKGKCDKVFINTSGIGVFEDENRKNVGIGKAIMPGDKIIINGPLADHGMAILASREGFNFKTDITTDCASLNTLIDKAFSASDNIRFMRDITRGGLSTVLCEVVEGKGFGLEIDESHTPVNESVCGICELLGFDPYYVANEGKVLIIVDGNDADKVLEAIKKDENGKEAAIIGEITEEHAGRGWILTTSGGKRIIDMLAGEQLPRIC